MKAPEALAVLECLVDLEFPALQPVPALQLDHAHPDPLLVLPVLEYLVCPDLLSGLVRHHSREVPERL